MTVKNFKRALKKMLKNGEFDVCIKNANFVERKKLKALKIALIKSGDIEKIPIWALLYEINSPILLKNIITQMIMFDDEKTE